jgi:phenylalanyl-tRNA synthetase beta chain
MPTIEISQKDLCNLIGEKIEMEELKNLMDFVKGEIESVSDGLLRIEIKDTNRPDLWSAEGIARELKAKLGIEKGLPEYKVKKTNVKVIVSEKVKKVRPYTVCAVVKNLKIDEFALSQIIQLQEKIANNFGKGRREVAIGIYDLKRIKPPIRFTTVKPEGIKFAPLDFEEELTPREILEKHPKGKEFGHLLKGLKEYPIFVDSRNEVLSLPPIINSNYSGKVTKNTKDVFIECSGFNFKFLIPSLNIIVCALAERGGEIGSVKIEYPEKIMYTPNLEPKSAFVELNYLNKISGLNLNSKQACELLEKARYKAIRRKNKIEVLYPAYRQDIMHQRDIVEDIIISYGFNEIKPVYPKIPTVGKASEKEIFCDRIAEIMIGLGFQQILSPVLTNRENLFKKMNLYEEKVIEIENPVSKNWNVMRSWLLPSLIEFLSNNLHVEYPQKIFEVGNVVLLNEECETMSQDVKKLACCIANSRVSYEEISSVLDALLTNLGFNYKLKKIEHKSFIQGRVAGIFFEKKQIGIMGEISPQVLENWKIEMPAAAFEISLEELFEKTKNLSQKA